MRVSCYVLGAQSYEKDGKVRTTFDLAVSREGRGVGGYEILGKVTLDGDHLDDFDFMLEEYYCDGSFVKFGDNQRFIIRSLSK